MTAMKSIPLIEIKQFIQAIRDAGYKGTSSAIAELVDNSLEANAKKVWIDIVENHEHKVEEIRVSDDGCGMTPSAMKIALQFGGSSRFGSTKGTGRYGMGLPNSSVSQAKRVDLYSWVKKDEIYRTYLDIDDIIKGTCNKIIEPKLCDLNIKGLNRNHGTVVVWTRCDRLSYNAVELLINQLKRELGRIFRKQIWKGKQILINGKPLLPIDPLFLCEGNNLRGASVYGSELEYDIKVPGNSTYNESSKVKVIFSELPVEKWHSFSNKEKKEYSISKNSGVSIIRADREIDRGWYFMGNKRKENYDDWWRCEVSFNPELDEMFGVTHTKQGINPSQELLTIMSTDMEAIAHKLYYRVFTTFMNIKNKKIKPSERCAEKNDIYFTPPAGVGKNNHIRGLKYEISAREISETKFYDAKFNKEKIEVILNEQHPFFKYFYAPLNNKNNGGYRTVKTYFEILLLAAARAEYQMIHDDERCTINKFKEHWSDLLAAYTL